MVGRVIRWTIRSGKSPRRANLCLAPGGQAGDGLEARPPSRRLDRALGGVLVTQWSASGSPGEHLERDLPCRRRSRRAIAARLREHPS